MTPARRAEKLEMIREREKRKIEEADPDRMHLLESLLESTEDKVIDGQIARDFDWEVQIDKRQVNQLME